MRITSRRAQPYAAVGIARIERRARPEGTATTCQAYHEPAVNLIANPASLEIARVAQAD